MVGDLSVLMQDLLFILVSIHQKSIVRDFMDDFMEVGRLHGSVGFTGGNFGDESNEVPEEEEPVEDPAEEETQVQDQVPVEDTVAPDPNAVQFGPETNPDQVFPVVLQEERKQDLQTFEANLVRWFELLYPRIRQIFVHEVRVRRRSLNSLNFRIDLTDRMIKIAHEKSVEMQKKYDDLKKDDVEKDDVKKDDSEEEMKRVIEHVRNVEQYAKAMKRLYEHARNAVQEDPRTRQRYPIISTDLQAAGIISDGASIDGDFCMKILRQGITELFRDEQQYSYLFITQNGRVTTDFFFGLAMWANKQDDTPSLYTPLDIGVIFYIFYMNDLMKYELMNKFGIDIWLPSNFYAIGYTYLLYGHTDLPEMKELFLLIRKQIEKYFWQESHWALKDPHTRDVIERRIHDLQKLKMLADSPEINVDVSYTGKYLEYYMKILEEIKRPHGQKMFVKPNPELTDSDPEEIVWSDRFIIIMFSFIQHKTRLFIRQTRRNGTQNPFYNDPFLLYWYVANAMRIEPYSIDPYNALDIAAFIHLYRMISVLGWNTMKYITWWKPFDFTIQQWHNYKVAVEDPFMEFPEYAASIHEQPQNILIG